MELIKSPQQIKEEQRQYIKHIENVAVHSLIKQFNEQLRKEDPNKKLYILHLYLERSAGFYDIENIKYRFISHCESANWQVIHVSILECQFTVTVSHK